MQPYQANFSFDYVPPVLKRGSHALLVLQDPAGKYILGSKNIYPDGIYRFIGGGIEDEDPQAGASRELKEELGIFIPAYQLEPLARMTAEIEETSSNQQHLFETYLYHATTKPDQVLHPSSDLDGIVHFSREEVQQLIKNYQSLSSALINLNPENNDGQFRWSDYGKFYSQIHQIGLDLTTKRQRRDWD